MRNLYELDNLSPEWARMCGGNTGDQGDEVETCVEFATLAEDGALAIRDSKNPGAGELRFTAAEMRTFVVGYAQANGITL